MAFYDWPALPMVLLGFALRSEGMGQKTYWPIAEEILIQLAVWTGHGEGVPRSEMWQTVLLSLLISRFHSLP